MTFNRPTCNAFVAYMQSWGVDVDVPAEVIVRALGLAEVGSNGIGPYVGRVNRSERIKGSSYRLVLGKAAGAYRLIKLS